MAKEKYTEKQLEKMSVEELRLLNKEDYTQQDLEKLSVEELRYILGDDFIGIPDGDFVLRPPTPCQSDIQCCLACGFGTESEPVDCDSACYCTESGYCQEGEDPSEPDIDPPDPPEVVRDSCEFRFGFPGTYGTWDNGGLCDWDYTGTFPGLGETPSWLCYFNASLGYGMYPYLYEDNSYHSLNSWHHGLNEDGTFGYYRRDEEYYADSMPGCVAGALNHCIENCEGVEDVTHSFACTCNGAIGNDYSHDINFDWENVDWTEIFTWMGDSYFNQHVTANICVRKPGGTIDRTDVYGKCTNGDPPYWVAPEIRTLQDHGGYPVYGYCCDVDAVNYSGNLACSVADEGNWVPLPSKGDSHNIPAYYYYDDDGTTRTLQRYHVDEGKDSDGNTCPTFEETHYYTGGDWYDCWKDGECSGIGIPRYSRRDPLGVKKSSCFCKYVDSVGNVCFSYEMYNNYDGTQVCYPSQHTPHEDNNRGIRSRLGTARTLSELQLQDNEPDAYGTSFKTGRHYIPDFTSGWSSNLLRNPSFSNGCTTTLDLDECVSFQDCPDVSAEIQTAIDTQYDSPGQTTICIPDGNYNIGSDITINKSNLTLKGSDNTKLYFGLKKGLDAHPNQNLDKFNKIINCVFENSAVTNTLVGDFLGSLLPNFQIYPGDDCDDVQKTLFNSFWIDPIETAFQNQCKDSWTGGDVELWPDNFLPSQAWRSTCKKWWAQSNSYTTSDDNYNYGYPLYDCNGEGNCEVYNELNELTGNSMWYVDCGEIGVNCSSNICNSILGSAFKYGCFMTEENLHSDPNRQEPNYYNMYHDYIDRCEYPTDETSCNANCLLPLENGVCKGFYQWEWHEDIDGEHFVNTAEGYSGEYMPDTEYPYNIQGGVSANRLGFYGLEADGTDLRMTPNEMFETFYIGGYCNPDTNYCEVHQNASDEDKEFYETRARYVNIDTGETQPLNGRPCTRGESGVGDIEYCGYEKTSADFCGQSCAQETTRLIIDGDLVFDGENKFELVETALNNSNYIYVEDNDVLACGDDIVISIPKDESTITDLIRADHNCEDYWPSNKIYKDIFYRTITKVITEEDGRLKLTLDTPIRYKLDLSYEPYVRKIISGWVKNSSIENLKVSNAVDFDTKSIYVKDGTSIIKIKSGLNCMVKDVESFSDGDFAANVHQDLSIDLIGEVDGLNPPKAALTSFLCIIDRLTHLNEFVPTDFSLFGTLDLGATDYIPTQLKYYSLDGVETVYNELENDDITEASGIVHSRQYDDVFWTHNDSAIIINEEAHPNIIYAFNSNGVDLGEFTLTGLTEPVNVNGETIHQRDWEDMAYDGTYLYIGEIGDNDRLYGTYYVHKCLEPDVNNPPTDNEISCTSIPFTYQKYNSEGEPTEGNVSYDAETLMVDTNGDIYIITKGALDFTNGSGDSKVFKLDIATNVANYVTDVSAFEDGEYIFLNPITGGDISSDGTSILIRTYEKIYKFNKSGTGEASVRAAINGEFVAVAYERELVEQGEAVAWAADGLGYYTISEEGTLYGQLIEVGIELLQFLLSGCPDGDFEPAKNVFDEMMMEMYTSNPSNVTNEPRHLVSHGITVDNSKHVIIKNCTLKLPQKRGENNNGYLFNIVTGNEILIEDCYGYRGRHNFTTGGLFGTSGIVYNRIKSEGGWGFGLSAPTIDGQPFPISLTDDDYWSRYQKLEFPGLGYPGFSDTHNGLTQTFLVTDSDLLDGFSTKNRHDMSGGAGITGANGIFWNVRGPVTTGMRWENVSVPGMGVLESFQYGLGEIKDYDENINLMRNVNDSNQFIKNTSSITTELITGEYVNPDDMDSNPINLISYVFDFFVQRFIEKYTGAHLSGIDDILIENFDISNPAGTDNACMGGFCDDGSMVVCSDDYDCNPGSSDILDCKYTLGFRNFKCPDGNNNCKELFTNFNSNVSLDEEYDADGTLINEELKIILTGDEFRLDFGFLMQSELGGPFNICALANTEPFEAFADNYSDAYFYLQNPVFEITLNPVGSNVNITSTGANIIVDEWGVNNNIPELLEFFAMYDAAELIRLLLDYKFYEIMYGGVLNEPLTVASERISAVINEETFKSFKSILFSTDGKKPSEGTGPSDKIYVNELSSGTSYEYIKQDGGGVRIPVPTYGYDEIPDDYNDSLPNQSPIIVQNITNSNNLFEYQKNFGSWFGANEEASQTNFQMSEELPLEQIFEGIYQNPSVIHHFPRFQQDCPFDWSTVPSASGDVNGDGGLNIQDIIVILNYILSDTDIGGVPTEDEFIRIADSNGDGIINIQDIIILIQRILEIDYFNPYDLDNESDELKNISNMMNYLLDTITLDAGILGEQPMCYLLAILTMDINGNYLFGNLDSQNILDGNICQTQDSGVTPSCSSITSFIHSYTTENLLPSQRIGNLITWSASNICFDDGNNEWFNTCTDDTYYMCEYSGDPNNVENSLLTSNFELSCQSNLEVFLPISTHFEYTWNYDFQNDYCTTSISDYCPQSCEAYENQNGVSYHKFMDNKTLSTYEVQGLREMLNILQDLKLNDKQKAKQSMKLLKTIITQKKPQK